MLLAALVLLRKSLCDLRAIVPAAEVGVGERGRTAGAASNSRT